MTSFIKLQLCGVDPYVVFLVMNRFLHLFCNLYLVVNTNSDVTERDSASTDASIFAFSHKSTLPNV